VGSRFGEGNLRLNAKERGKVSFVGASFGLTKGGQSGNRSLLRGEAQIPCSGWEKSKGVDC